MPTRNVVLTDRHEAFIHGLVESGRYHNASEVMREALRSLEQREIGTEGVLDWLNTPRAAAGNGSAESASVATATSAGS